MKRRNRIALALACLAFIVAAAGCAAKSRNGPRDVPVATPAALSGQDYGSAGLAETGTGKGTGSSASAGRGRGGIAVSGDVKRAAADIAATTIYFALNRAELSADACRSLDRVGDILKQTPAIRISLQGHCDERGPAEYNYGLGARRARAAYAYLTRAGVNAAQLDMVTYGEDTPASPGGGEASWGRNRRVEFVVLTVCN
ncbi:MAG: OmpA family protein [Deltaproteobacteria bacterium]|jgi:peptidoglycan-associated lipoprotein|nr:OmpA family protein [Deltaproteobacteria bacterium]